MNGLKRNRLEKIGVILISNEENWRLVSGNGQQLRIGLENDITINKFIRDLLTVTGQ